MLATQLATLIEHAPFKTLDNVSRDIWRALGAGMLSDDDAQALAEAIHARRNQARAQNTGQNPSGTVSRNTRTWSYFPPKRRPQRSPDRQRSLERRRLLASSGPMPPALAAKFTTGELAVLKIVADEIREKGTCTLSIPEIAARAGVGQTKTRMALQEASKLGLVTIEERRIPYRPNLPNVVRIISREWLAWISRGPRKSGYAEDCRSSALETRQVSQYSNSPMRDQGEGPLLRSPRESGVSREG